jgi:hypothetical protein
LFGIKLLLVVKEKIMPTPNILKVIPPPFPEAEPPDFDPIAEIRLNPNMQPRDLSDIRKKVISAVAGSTVDLDILAYVTGELVADAADLSAADLEEAQHEHGIAVSAPAAQIPELQRHAEKVTVGRNREAGRLILGVSDDMPFWVTNPLRPQIVDDMGGLTGRGLDSVKGLVLSATVTTVPEGKTVWVELSEPAPTYPVTASNN